MRSNENKHLEEIKKQIKAGSEGTNDYHRLPVLDTSPEGLERLKESFKFAEEARAKTRISDEDYARTYAKLHWITVFIRTRFAVLRFLKRFFLLWR